MTPPEPQTAAPVCETATSQIETVTSQTPCLVRHVTRRRLGFANGGRRVGIEALRHDNGLLDERQHADAQLRVGEREGQCARGRGGCAQRGARKMVVAQSQRQPLHEVGPAASSNPANVFLGAAEVAQRLQPRRNVVFRDL